MSTRRQTMMQLGAAGAALLLPRAVFPAGGRGRFPVGRVDWRQFRSHARRSRRRMEPAAADARAAGGGRGGGRRHSRAGGRVDARRPRPRSAGAGSGAWRKRKIRQLARRRLRARLGLLCRRLRTFRRVLPAARRRPLSRSRARRSRADRRAHSLDALEGSLQKPFAKLREHLAAVAASPDYPKIPIEEATAAALALDRLSFLDYLKQQHVEPSLFGLIDAYCYSSLGAGASEVSAYAGVNFYSEITGRIFAFPGGNAVLARTMVDRVSRAGAGRLVTGAAVFAVEPSEGGLARVGWFDAARPGEPRCIAARWVVVAAPFFFAGRILRGIDPKVAATMTGLKSRQLPRGQLLFRRPSRGFDIRQLDAR